MKKTCKISVIMAASMIVTSVVLAEPTRGRAEYRSRDHHPSYRHSYSSHYNCRPVSRHYGYSRVDSGRLAVGLFGLAAVTAIASSAHPSETVYVQRQMVYAPPPPVVVVREQPVVVQQAAACEPPQPFSMTINVQNSNGSMTPVTLRQIGVQWVGPRGEYYDNLPSVGQLRPVYGF